MKRYELDGTYFYCPVDLTLSIIGGRWKGLVFWNLRDGAKRYGEMKRILVGINDKMLTQVLRELEANGVVNRKVYEVLCTQVFCVCANTCLCQVWLAKNGRRRRTLSHF